MSVLRRMQVAVAVVAIAALGVPAAAVAGGGHDGGADDWSKDRGSWHGHGGKPGKPPRAAIKVLASGLEGPFGIDAKGNKVFVAESGANRITRVGLRWGDTSAAVSGLLSPSGVARAGGGIVSVTGGSDIPDASISGDASVMFAYEGHAPQVLADLEAYELANNPDGQLQFDPVTGEPLDALSNPFAVIKAQGRPFVLVADGGANAVLAVSRWGEVSTFFVPPLVTTGACADAPNNDPEHTGCDPVPTGLAYGPHGRLYVSTLSAEAPGEGRVYVLNARTAEVIDVIGGFSGPTGVAVAPNGTVFVSEVLEGAPEGEPGPDFDPSTVGRIVRVSPNGKRTVAQVTMPVGLDYHDGTLYSSAWAIAGFLGIPAAGQIVSVAPHAFG